MTPSAVVLILSDSRGQYIPRDFLSDDDNKIDIKHCAAWGLTEANRSQWSDALYPDHDNYWDAWQWILDNARFQAGNGDIYTLHQDGDLWALCVERMTAEEKENFGFED